MATSSLSLLTTYTSSDEEGEEERPRKKPRDATSARLQSATCLFPETSYTKLGSEERSLHEGRVRSFSHAPNTWATHVYLEVFSDLCVTLLGAWSQRGLLDGLTPMDAFHLSLTRVGVVLRYHWIDAFVKSLKTQLALKTETFEVVAKDIELLVNEGCNRTFVVLSVSSSSHLLSLASKMDVLLTEYNLPLFYKPANFHVSVAWCLGDRRQELQARLSALNELLERTKCEESDVDGVARLKCSIGNKSFCFEFAH